jgi:hypothetical protein
MLNLTVAYVNQADREREIEDGLRRRRLLNPQDESTTPAKPSARSMATHRQTPVAARAAGR